MGDAAAVAATLIVSCGCTLLHGSERVLDGLADEVSFFPAIAHCDRRDPYIVSESYIERARQLWETLVAR